MKTSKILLLSALALMLGVTSSCHKDDNNNLNLPAATLTGKWFYSKVGTTLGGSEVLVNYDGNEPGCSKDFIVIGDNNVFSDVDYDSSNTPCEETNDLGTYAVTGNTIVVDFGGDSTTGTILNLSYTELKIKDSNSDAIVVYTRE